MAEESNGITKLPEELIKAKEVLSNGKPEIFEGITESNQRQILSNFSSLSLEYSSHYSGPIPDAESLEKYNQIVPDGANRIIKMTEDQQAHRMELEKNHLRSQSNQSMVGQIIGGIITLSTLACGALFMNEGYSKTGGTIICVTAVSLASLFLIGKKAQTS